MKPVSVVMSAERMMLASAATAEIRYGRTEKPAPQFFSSGSPHWPQ
jgi:hypothetical protein